MTAKTVIITFSLIASAAAVAGWIFAGRSETPAGTAQTGPPAVRPRRPASPPVVSSPVPSVPAEPSAVSHGVPAGSSGTVSAAPVPRPVLTTGELTARAARVEQEANHDLRRLVKLLNLDEAQQDKAFQALARHSPSWAPGMQFETAGSSAAAVSGLSGGLAAGIPGTAGGPVETPGTGTGNTVAPGSDAAASLDPMDEIMALLSPGQQDTLLQEEMDRNAWWADILQQITPADDVPALDGTTAPQNYEGSTTLD